MAAHSQAETTTEAITPTGNHAQSMELLSKPAGSATPHDPFLVAFQEPFDKENPLDWPRRRKWAVTNALSIAGFNRIMVSTIMAPALQTIQVELGMNNAETAMALSIYLLATAFGPLVIGPVSEICGRRIVLYACNVWFLIWNIGCGFANTKELLIAARFFAGLGASSIYALSGGVLGDVWRPEERGRSLRICLMIQVLGLAIGPIIGGFMAERTTWRWMFWSTSIFQAVLISISYQATKETYAPVLLKKRAEKIRRQTGNEQYRTSQERSDQDTEHSISRNLRRDLSRPFRFMVFHPVIQVTSVILAFNYGILYIVLSSFASIWVVQYGQSTEISGLHYLSCMLGELAGSQVGGPLIDRYFLRVQQRAAHGKHEPEDRIPLVVPGAVIISLGLLLYGWTAQYRLHWVSVDVGAFIIMFGFQISQMPMQAYIMDAYAQHTSSALAASQFLRSLTAFLFPLFAPSLFEALGYGWGHTIISLCGLVIGILTPIFIWRLGARLRDKARSRY